MSILGDAKTYEFLVLWNKGRNDKSNCINCKSKVRLINCKKGIQISFYVFTEMQKYDGYTESHVTAVQGCGLGLEVSVSRQSRELTTSRLGLGLFHVVGRDVLCGVRAVWRSM